MTIKLSDLPPAVRAAVKAQAGAANPKRSKYGNVKTEVDDIKFDSRKEADYYASLKLGVAQGWFSWFARQPRFDLPGGIVYVADFIVSHPCGKVEVVDVKGVRTDVYKLKKKLMRATYGIEIKEV